MPASVCTIASSASTDTLVSEQPAASDTMSLSKTKERLQWRRRSAEEDQRNPQAEDSTPPKMKEKEGCNIFCYPRCDFEECAHSHQTHLNIVMNDEQASSFAAYASHFSLLTTARCVHRTPVANRIPFRYQETAKSQATLPI
ncbi:hypothetical protein Hypma_008392 [Hypsizygus marmoreus]|uniref:Uncharacterized protein n=1 Tax=Hypsizygus marmoreus TaxID=39966 RepID=A0A369JT06_HYPMA|nr:hypothetical protein Hypma_008392 [Hypsizygus marmoreus]